MRCFYPLQAWQSHAGDIHFYPKGTEGKRGKLADYRRELCLPCGQCIGCLVSRTNDWGVRIMHETSMHDACAFLTLTYTDDTLPYQGQLIKWHFQDYMKRLRYYFPKVRYYMCGEYGELYDRPHFHCILFGHDFAADREPLSRLPQGGFLYSSRVLDKLWSYGFCSIGEVTYESATYVARYCLKKVTGKGAEAHYTRVDSITGEIYQKVPEYSAQSFGIGASWLEKYSSDVVNAGGVMDFGVNRGVPRYYGKVLESRDGFQKDLLDLTRLSRSRTIEPNDNSYERMRVKEEVFKAKIGLKKRLL